MLVHFATRRTVTRVALSIALLGAAGSVVGLGASATFTGTASTSPAFTSGTLSMAPIGISGANNRLSVGANDLAPGDTVQRAVNLRNSGTVAVSGVTLTTTATQTSSLDTDATYGLQLVIDRCSVAWTESGPPYTYVCGGSTSSVLASTPVVGSAVALANLNTAAGADNYLRVTLTLPATAPNAMQNQSSTILFTFAAAQRAAGPQ